MLPGDTLPLAFCGSVYGSGRYNGRGSSCATDYATIAYRSPRQTVADARFCSACIHCCRRHAAAQALTAVIHLVILLFAHNYRTTGRVCGTPTLYGRRLAGVKCAVRFSCQLLAGLRFGAAAAACRITTTFLVRSGFFPWRAHCKHHFCYMVLPLRCLCAAGRLHWIRFNI